jgi:hypothetical protein
MFELIRSQFPLAIGYDLYAIIVKSKQLFSWVKFCLQVACRARQLRTVLIARIDRGGTFCRPEPGADQL